MGMKNKTHFVTNDKQLDPICGQKEQGNWYTLLKDHVSCPECKKKLKELKDECVQT